LAQALYSLFGADDEALAVLREGCFKYFEMGGECVAGPVGLLSGLRPRPTLLVYHFFKVALFSIWCLFAHPRVYASRSGEVVRKPGVAEYPSLAWKSILVFYTACVVILPVIWTEVKANAPTFEDVASSAATIGDQSKGKKNKSRRSIPLLLALATVLLGLYLVQVPQDASLRGSDGLSDGAFHDLLDRVNSSFQQTRKTGYMSYLPLPKRYLA
jgi:squalene monooxygenase